MYTYQQLHEHYTGRLTEQVNGETVDPRRGRLNFLKDFYEALGLKYDSDPTRVFVKDAKGRPTYPANSLSADDFSIKELAEVICGRRFVEQFYHPNSGFDFSNPLTEAALDPSAFLNVSTFNLTVAGLVDAKIMERWALQDFVMDKIYRTMPTNKNGDKFIGIARVPTTSRVDKGRQPGEPHAEVGVTERYQTSPVTFEQGLKILFTKESVYFDYTGQLLEEGGKISEELFYGREKLMIDEFIGVTNTHNYEQTSYNTYQASSPWINTFSNDLTDYENVDLAWQKFLGMKDPDTSKEIKVTPNYVLVQPGRVFFAQNVIRGARVLEGTAGQVTAGNFPSRFTDAANPVNAVLPQLAANVLYSQIVFNRHTAADGLNLSSSNATKYWYLGESGKSHYWMENWPLTPWQASPSEYVMKDRGLIAVFGANWRGVPYTFQPRYVVQSTN